MGFRRCGQEDPFTRQVRTLYRANVLRVPRTGLDPLDVLLVRGRHVQIHGRLAEMLDGTDQPALPEPAPYAVADLSGLRSVGLEVEFGLNLCAVFLNSLGVPSPGVELNTSLWKGTQSVNFEVRGVTEWRMDLGSLGKSLKGRKVDTTSPTTAILATDDKVRMMVITRTFASRRFAIHGTSEGGQSVDIAVDAIQNLIGKSTAGVKWSKESAQTVTFEGDAGVTFAFGAAPCVLQPDGSFFFGVESSDLTFGEASTKVPADRPVIDEDGLLDFD